MAFPKNSSYRTFADFERDEIRPAMRIGWSMNDELNNPHDAEIDFDLDPWESALDKAEYEDDDDE
jgi:hypothetical protein